MTSSLILSFLRFFQLYAVGRYIMMGVSLVLPPSVYPVPAIASDLPITWLF